MLPLLDDSGSRDTCADVRRNGDGSASHSTQDRATPRKQVACHLCDQPMLKRVLQRHLRTVHFRPQGNQTPPKYGCLQCRKTFARSDILNRHQAEQHGDGSSLVECIACGANIHKRALEDHYKTRRCQYIQHLKDRSQMQRITQIDLVSLVDPLLAAAVSNIKQCRYLGSLTSKSSDSRHHFVEFLHFRGIALRAVFRAFKAPTGSERPQLCLALYALMVPDRGAKLGGEGLSDEQNGVMAEGINALQKDFEPTLIHHGLWGPRGIVTQLRAHLMPLEFMSEQELLTGRQYWPDIFRPRIISTEPFEREVREMVWRPIPRDSGYDTSLSSRNLRHAS